MANRQNYLAKIQLNRGKKIAAGLVSEVFPQVSGMVINMIYYQKVTSPILMLRTVNVFPTSYAYFDMECKIKGCENGGFNLTSVIANMVKSRKTSAKGKMLCAGKNGALSTGHASVSYEINIRYSAGAAVRKRALQKVK
jgi:hypothetical protein